MNLYIHNFQDPAAAHNSLSGGKGANLALLTQRGFPVPDGFIVTAATYQGFIRGARDLIEAVNGFYLNDPGQLREQSARLKAELARLQLPSEAIAEIRRRLQRFPADQAFSVRSSSTMEDLASAAFAGQHETYLNCLGEEMILEKIKECFLSLWSDRAIAYRHQQHFDHSQAVMAVVVQSMVSCEVAGVGFSINPVSGDMGEMIVDANYGLGESVVSGQSEVDHWAIEKATGKVRSAQIAVKCRKVVADRSGTRELEIAKEQASQPCLGESELAQVSGLLAKVEQSYGFPQDIEWGIAQGQIFLLQSRPITTIPPRWTRDESAERFPNVITPLTWDFVDDGFHRSLSHSFRLIGFPPFNGKWFGMHGHYIYGNQNAVDLYARRSPFTIRSVNELKESLPRIREQYRWVQELPVAWFRDLDHYLITLGQFTAEPLQGKSPREVWDYVLRVNEHGAKYFLPNIAISITHSTLFRLLHHLLRLGFGERADLLFDDLMAFCETKTGMINKELFELAQLVRAEPSLEKLFQTQSSQDIAQENHLAGYPVFQARLGKFLQDHGHREVDFDAYAPTWVETPWVVLDNLRLILQMPIDQHPAAKERELKMRMQKAELALFQQLPPELHYFFGEILRLARIYTSLDDLEHYQTTRLTPALRRGLRQLGLQLAAKGVLTDPMDVFFARKTQIDQAIAVDADSGWVALRTAIQEQKMAYLADKARKPEWVPGDPHQAEATANSLTGLPGSAGQAEGTVFVVLAPEDFAKFPKGAVLVTRTTNPTWTPLFYSAVAVVTESGGPLSHGAVTAREMGLPAVMSVRAALTALKTGQRVRVDGSAGKVHLL